MNYTAVLILFGLVVLITHFLEGITGFGCTVLALPFCTMLVGLKTAVPTLIVLAWLLALYVIIVDHKNIVWKQYLKILCLLMLGLPIGIFLFSRMPEHILRVILGVFMLTVASRGIYVSFRRGAKKLNVPGFLMNAVLFAGGIIHGAFGSSGPFVVIYAAKYLPDKSNFRATLCMLWFTLNTVIIAQKFASHAMTMPVMQTLLVSLPFLAAGMLLGNAAHGRINAGMFTKLIYFVLFVSGIFMFI
jgi:uncharacterized membrane protein YfcA